MGNETITVETLREQMFRVAGDIEKANMERLRRLSGMDFIVNEFLPKGTIMIMVAPDVSTKLHQILREQGNG